MKKLLLYFLIALISVPPAFAIEFSSGDFKARLSGSIFADVFYTYSSRNAEPFFTATSYSSGQHSIGSYALVGLSRVTLQVNYKNVTGELEVGLFDLIRKAYMQYNIGGKKDHYFLAGRQDNIAFYYYGQVSNSGQSMIDYGAITNKRRMQFRYGVSGFEVAIILSQIGFGLADDRAYTDTLSYGDYSINATDYMLNYLPRLDLGYTFAIDNFNMKIFVSYGAYVYHNGDKNNDYMDTFDKIAHMYYLGFGGASYFGGSFINYVGYYGQNMYLSNAQGDYRAGSGKAMLNPISLVLHGDKYSIDINNVYSAGASIGYGYKAFGGKFVPQVGLGYSINFAFHYESADQNIGAFLNSKYFINEWFLLIPEVALLYNVSNASGSNDGISVVMGITAAITF